MKQKFLGVLLLAIVVWGCSKKVAETRVFFGGQIIKPTSENVTLYQGNNVLDTFRLDNNMRFQKRYEDLESGIFKLEHLPEFQSVLLEKGDSIWVRFNAAAFDESIVYSGPGASKNNFMMELLLDFERENDFLSSKFSLNKEAYNAVIDSLLNQKKIKWILMDSLNRLSPIAQKVTQASYIYPYANKKERYALLRGAQWTAAEDSLYFDYRKYLNFSDNDLAFFDPYINYILNYISQKALKKGEAYFLQKQSTDFNFRRLEVLNDEISGNLLRSNLARAIAFEEILNFENHANHDRFLQYFATINSSPQYLAEVLNLHSDISGMERNKPLPEIELENSNREKISSNTLLGQGPTVIYFWSQTQMSHYKGTLDRMKILQAQHPKLRFVGICIQPFTEVVAQVQKMMNVDADNQFAIVDFEKASKLWVLTLLNKCIVLDRNGKIIEGFGNFSDKNLDLLLNQF